MTCDYAASIITGLIGSRQLCIFISTRGQNTLRRFAKTLAFKHCKAIAADEQAIQVLEATYFLKKLPEEYSTETVLEEGVVIGGDPAKLTTQFIQAIAQHRFWEREKPRKVPA